MAHKVVHKDSRLRFLHKLIYLTTYNLSIFRVQINVKLQRAVEYNIKKTLMTLLQGFMSIQYNSVVRDPFMFIVG